MPYSYQVKRAEFDEILIRNAAQEGVQVQEGCTARSVDPARPHGARTPRARRRQLHRMEREVPGRPPGRDTFPAYRHPGSGSRIATRDTTAPRCTAISHMQGALMVALALMVIPFWISILVRTYAWIVVLGNAGIVKCSKLALGPVDEPLAHPRRIQRHSVTLSDPITSDIHPRPTAQDDCRWTGHAA